MRVCVLLVLSVSVWISMFFSVYAVADDSRESQHLFILAGQSNMRKPLPQSFSTCVQQVFGDDRVIVATAAHPGQPIRNWYKKWTLPKGMMDAKFDPQKNGQLYDRLMQTVRRAIKVRPIETLTLVWMQGEADAGSGWGERYEEAFLGILEQIKNDLQVENINFVIGRINDHWIDPERYSHGEMIRELQVKLGDKHSNGAWVDTDDLNRGVNPWGGFSFDDGHFPPAGYRVMGQRMAAEAVRLIDPQIALDDPVFEEVFFDDVSSINSHAAIGKPVTSSQSIAGLASLTDGVFGDEDIEDSAWMAFKPQEDPLEIVIDLGEVIEIDSVAIPTLLSSEANAEFPHELTISVSQDGKTYQTSGQRYNNIKFANAKQLAACRKQGIKPVAVLLWTQQSHRNAPVQARYVKVAIETGQQHVLIDEMIVNPAVK